MIYDPDSKTPMHVDDRYNGKWKLNIMLHNKHFTAMRSLQACFGAKYICIDCNTHTRTRAMHFCKYSCTQCLSPMKCPQRNPLMSCAACNRTFFGPGCYNNHLQKTKSQKCSTCDLKKNCPTCFSSLYKGHVCGKKMCYTCEKLVSKIDHLCYMPKYVSKRQSDTQFLNVFFDLETQQNTPLSDTEPDKFKHIPSLCVSQAVCSECYNVPDISSPCYFCGNEKENVYKTGTWIEKFMDYIVDKHNEKKVKKIDGKDKIVDKYDYINVLAHNLKGFDGQFILQYIYESKRTVPK